MGAVLETGDTSTTRTISQSNFMKPFDFIVSLSPLDIIHVPPLIPKHSRQNRFFPFIAMFPHGTSDNEQVEK